MVISINSAIKSVSEKNSYLLLTRSRQYNKSSVIENTMVKRNVKFIWIDLHSSSETVNAVQ